MHFAPARSALYYKAPIRYTLSLGLSALAIAGLCGLALLAGSTGSKATASAPRYAGNKILSVRFVPQPVSSPALPVQSLEQIEITPIPSPPMPDSEPAVAVDPQPATAQGTLLHEIRDGASIDERRESPGHDEAEHRAAKKSLHTILQTALKKQLIYPAAARRAGIEGTVRLLLRITQNGDLETMNVIESSGSGLLDRAAQRLARRVFPIPGTWPSGLETSISIDYRLE